MDHTDPSAGPDASDPSSPPEQAVQALYPLSEEPGTSTRRRAVVAGAIALLVVGACTAIVATRGRATQIQLTTAQQQALDCASVLRPGASTRTALVFMEPDATQQQRDEVERTLEELRGTRHVDFVDQQQAYEEFTLMFADQPSLVSQVTPSLLPTRFVVELDDATATADPLASVRSLPAVKRTTGGFSACHLDDPEARRLLDASLRNRWRWGIDLIIFMEPDATPNQLAAARSRLVDDAANRHVWFLDKQGSLAEFRCLFANEPKMLADVTAEILPPNYRIDVGDPPVSPRIIDELSTMAGVKRVVGPPTLEELLEKADGPGLSADDLGGADPCDIPLQPLK